MALHPPLVLDALVPGTTYKLKAGSGTTEGLRTRGFTTNDDCADAINLPVQNEDDPLVFTHAVTYGATESANACVSGTDDDVWFTFTATAPTILLSALADGTALRYELNTGACGCSRHGMWRGGLQLRHRTGQPCDRHQLHLSPVDERLFAEAATGGLGKDAIER
ncbi:MAG: hypothetical protein IPG74_14695 [Flavobacteriales bacterium]|nr:hypothetical protein [Flavobacteriales bacterium]